MHVLLIVNIWIIGCFNSYNTQSSDSEMCKLYVKTTKQDMCSPIPTNFWPLNGNTNDIVGGANMYGLINASPTTDRFGKVNSAIRFSAGYAQIPAGVYFYGEYSAMAWIKVYENGYWPKIFDFGNGMNSDNVLITYSSDSKLNILSRFHVASVSNSITFKDSIKLNEWTHVAVTKSSTEFRAYVNGAFKNSVANSALPRNLIRKMCYIGKSNWDWDGLANADMDDIKIFNLALNDTDVYNHFNSIFP